MSSYLPFITRPAQGEHTAIVFIHGFLGRADDFSPFFPSIHPDFRPYAISLPGHFPPFSPPPLSDFPDNLYRQLSLFLKSIPEKNTILAGYSLGGRVALEFTMTRDLPISALILESTNPGIENISDRQSRIDQDNALATSLIGNGIRPFLDSWMDLPLFAGMKECQPQNFADLLAYRLTMNPHALAPWLTGFSPGLRPSFWPQLPSLNIPLLLLAGQNDSKYSSILAQAHRLIQSSHLHILPQASHNTHFCQPDLYLQHINSFLRSLIL